MASPYRTVLRLPGATAFSVAGVIARLPISMVSLGLVILVADRTDSYSYAGGVSAAYVAANALAAVPLARLVDRIGQRRVLAPAATLSALGVGLAVAAVESGAATPLPHLCAVLAGATLPNVGAAVRARWSHAVTERSQLDTAFALEAVNDELVFIAGPTLVTLLASAVDPVLGLFTATTALLVGTGWLVSQRLTEPPLHRSDGVETGPRPALPWGRLLPLAAGAVMLGILFGGTEVATVALTDEAGRPAAAGPLLAVWALGSLLSGLVAGGLTYRRSAASRYRLGVTALAVLMLPLPLVDSLVPLGFLLFLAGFAVSPTMIAAVSWVEESVPTARLNEGMTVFTTGLVAGVAPGAALVGLVVDARGASPSYAVPAAAGVVAAVVALLVGVVSRDRPADADGVRADAPPAG